MPALLLWLLAAADLVLASRDRIYSRAAGYWDPRLLLVLAGLGLAALPFLFFAPARRKLERWVLAGGDRAAYAATAAVFARLLFLKWCQYRSLQLPIDTAVTTSLAFNAGHLGTLESSVLGVRSYLAVHFMPGVALLAPLLLVWRSAVPLIVVQTAALASLPLAAYLLAARRANPLAGWAAFWLAATSPALANMAGASVAWQVGLPAFVLWGAWCLETGRWKGAAACAVLCALTIEAEAPLILALAGGIIAVEAPGGLDQRRARFVGGGVIAAAILLVLGERVWMDRLADACVTGACHNGADFARRSASLVEIARPTFNAALSTAFLCLLSPLHALALLGNMLPHALANPGAYYHDLRLHYSAYVAGLLFWALAAGAAAAARRAEKKGLGPVVAAAVLLAAAWNAWTSPFVLLQRWNDLDFDEIPVLSRRIPPDAPVWAFQYATSWLGARSYLKAMPQEAEDANFIGLPFVPDYILVQREWLQSEASFRARMLAFLAAEGYVKDAELVHYVLLKHPKAPLNPGGRPPAFTLPSAPTPAGNAYADFIARNDDRVGTLAFMKRLADAGDAKAQAYVADDFAFGRTGKRDMEEAMRWLTRSAETGDLRSTVRVGRLYADRREFEAAAAWFRRAADGGDAEGQDALGLCYLRGAGVPMDLEQARRWLAASAAQGYAAGQSDYGALLLQQGRHAEAFTQFNAAAAQGFPRGKHNLAVCYLKGVGVPENEEKAMRLFKEAAAAGDSEAISALQKLGVKR